MKLKATEAAVVTRVNRTGTGYYTKRVGKMQREGTEGFSKDAATSRW
jgi:hypothetical protein